MPSKNERELMKKVNQLMAANEDLDKRQTEQIEALAATNRAQAEQIRTVTKRVGALEEKARTRFVESDTIMAKSQKRKK